MSRDARPTVVLAGDTLAVGGTEAQLAELAIRLRQRGWDTDVTCLRATGPLRAKLDAAEIRAWTCGRGSGGISGWAATVLALARAIRRRRAALVHAFDFYSNMVAVPAARMARVPVIASQRDLGNLRSRSRQRMHEAVLARATRVLVNSPAVAATLRHAVPSSKLVVVPNGVDLDRFARPSADRGTAERVRFGTLANLRPEKGVADVVTAMGMVRERYDNVRLAVHGSGPLHDEIERLVARLGLADIVELRGAAARPEVVLRELDVFVLASVSEACPNAVLEAMATGLPVVATRVGGIPFLVEDEVEGLLVPPRDPAGLAKALVRLVESPDRRATLGANARRRAEADFGIDVQVSRVERLWETTLAETAARAGVAA